jgi:hypothetical protein
MIAAISRQNSKERVENAMKINRPNENSGNAPLYNING